MSIVAPATPADLPAGKPGRPFRLRIIPPIDTYPSVVSFAQTWPGKITLLLVFAFVLSFSMPDWRFTALWLGVITALPARRRLLVTIGMIQWTFLLPLERTTFSAMIVPILVNKACVLALAGILFWCAIRFRQSLFGRRPLVVLLTVFAVFIFAAGYLPGTFRFTPTVWSFATIASSYLWFIGYCLLDRDSKNRDNFSLQLGTFRPFWGSTNTPYPKGAAYLRRVEAKNAEQLAVTQLKGLKLLVWALILHEVSVGTVPFAHHFFAIPEYSVAFASSVQRAPYPWFVCWASLISEFMENVLNMSITGHRIVVCCRMAGFAALRNTYRPLESRTIAEFWNRYYFYFKELLVDMFFFPTFLRYFKKRPKLRLIAATFAAACFGNIYYHFFVDLGPIQRQGFWHAVAGYKVYAFYCVVLATAISISQLRKRKPIAAGWIRGHLAPVFGVGLFYCLLRVFSDSTGNYPIHEHFRFFGHLFNL